MKSFNLLVKLAAFALILYVFMQQKGDYYKEMAKPKPEPMIEKTKPATVPAKTK